MVKKGCVLMKINRIQAIYTHLKDVGSISIDELCDRYGVSKNTIRRDIAELAKDGLIHKVYGGITLAEKNNGTPEIVSERENRETEVKKRIAKAAAGYVESGDVIYIDSGTTTMHMIPFLAQLSKVTVVTANLFVVNACAGHTNINVIGTGGLFYHPSNSFIGTPVIRCIEKCNIAKTFFAATGVSLESGAANASPAEAEIKRKLMEKTGMKYLLADHSKFEKNALMTYGELKDFDVILSDGLPPESYRDYFAEHRVEYVDVT